MKRSNGFAFGKRLLSNTEFFNAIYKLLALIAVSVTVAPFTGLLLYGFPWFISLPMSLILGLFGLMMQSIYGTVAKVKREEYIGSYERGIRYFKPKHAVLSLTITAVIAFVARYLTDRYLYHLFVTGRAINYDPNSLAPWLIAIMIVTPIVAGIVIWFYPHDKIISTRTIFVFLAVHFIAFLLCSRTPIVTTLSFIIFLLCALIILNQSYIQRLVEHSKVGSLTPQMRFYNIAMVAVILVMVAVAMIFVLSAVIGIVVLFRIFIYFLLASALREDTYQRADTVASAAGNEIFSGFMDIPGGSNVLFFFGMFCVTLVFLAAFFILVRKIDIIKIIGNFLSMLYNNILDFITNAFYFNRSVKQNVEYFDYLDDEKTIDNTSAATRRTTDLRPKKSYRDFIHKLNSLKTHPEKINFAYITLVKFWKEMDLMIQTADTPRQIRDKVKSRTEIKTLDDMTALFERVKYAESNETDEGMLDEMCVLIRRYYDQ